MGGGLQRGFKIKCVKTLSSIVRGNDEFDIVGLIYSMVTKEPDFKIDGGYTYPEIFNAYNRIEKVYGIEVKRQLIQVINFLQNKYFLDYENFQKQDLKIFKNNLIIEKEKDKIPFINNKFNAQFVTNEIIEFCIFKKGEMKNVRNK